MQVNDYFLHVQRTTRPSGADPSVDVPATVVSIYTIEDYKNTKNITELVENATPKATGMARLNPRDQINRRRGLLIAGGRAAKELGLKFTFARYEYTKNVEIESPDDEPATWETQTVTVGEYALAPIDSNADESEPASEPRPLKGAAQLVKG